MVPKPRPNTGLGRVSMWAERRPCQAVATKCQPFPSSPTEIISTRHGHSSLTVSTPRPTIREDAYLFTQDAGRKEHRRGG